MITESLRMSLQWHRKALIRNKANTINLWKSIIILKSNQKILFIKMDLRKLRANSNLNLVLTPTPKTTQFSTLDILKPRTKQTDNKI